jgi:hypothetical protein
VVSATNDNASTIGSPVLTIDANCFVDMAIDFVFGDLILLFFFANLV